MGGCLFLFLFCWQCSSVVQNLISMLKVLNSTPITKRKEEEVGETKEEEKKEGQEERKNGLPASASSAYLISRHHKKNDMILHIKDPKHSPIL